MAIAKRDTDSANASTATAVTLSSWSGVVENDFVAVICTITESSAADWDDLSNWAKVVLTGFLQATAIYYRLIPSGGLSTVTFNHTAASGEISASGIALSGVDLTHPVLAVGGNRGNFTSATPVNLPVVVSGWANAWALALCGINDDTFNTTHQPSGYTAEIKEEGNAAVGTAITSKDLGSGTPPISEAPGDWTIDTFERYATALMLLKAA